MHLEYVITLEQDAEVTVQARAQARAEAAEARAQAQENAQRAREDVREEMNRMRQEIREQVRAQMQHPEHPQPGTIVIPAGPPWEHGPIPPQIVDLITLFVIAMVICIVGFPLARAFGRWIDRRGLPSPVNAELAAQINRIEQAVDSVAVEVERISEAQRFQAKLLAEKVQA